MPGLPATCRSCFRTFETQTLALGGGASIHIGAGAKMAVSCPFCGGQAEIGPGTYQAVGNAMRVMRDTRFTPQQVLQIRTIQREMAQKPKPADDRIPEEVVEALTAIAPVFGSAIRLLQSGHAGWLVFLLFLHLILSRCDELEGTGTTSPVVQNISVTNVYNLEPPSISYNVSQSPKNQGTKDPGTSAKASDGKMD